jgi:hypothetical protein
VGAEFHVDRQTDMMKITVAFHNSANVPKNAYRVLVGELERKTPRVKTQA